MSNIDPSDDFYGRTFTVNPVTRPTGPLRIDLNRLDGIEGVRIMSHEIDRWISADKHAHTLKLLATRAGLAVRTVSNIWYRLTVQPRLSTMILILRALGFQAVRFD